MTDPTQEFRQTLQAAGLTPPDTLIPGKLHRCPSNDRHSDKAGWCKLFDDGMGGVYGDHRSSTSETWQFRQADRMSDADRESFRQQVEQARRERDAEQARSHREAAKKAVELWNRAKPLAQDHPYLKRKLIAPVDSLREIDTEDAAKILEWSPRGDKGLLQGRLIVAPVYIGNNLVSLELIDDRGWKAAQKDGKRAGAWWAAQPFPEGDGTDLVLIIGEGIATVLSVKQATGYSVVAALSCGNLANVALAMRQRYPKARLLFCADIGNGQDKAFAAARQTNGMAIIPRWEGIPNMTPEQQAKATDFNDLHRLAGLDAVRAQIDDAVNGWRQEQAEPANDSPEESERQQRAGKREKPPIKPAKAYSIAEFLSITLPPRINLLSPWLPAQGLAMVYAPRGIGKTFFGLNVAYAVASGGQFLCWKAEAAMRVMYIDGEMPAVTMQERLAAIVNSHEAEAAGDALLIVTPDMQDGEPMPDLSTIEGQAAIAPLLEGVRLIVVDNISTLCRTGTENESDSWDVVQMWALKQRSAGRSVLFVHHAGKTGAQRGTSKREDVLDTVIALRRPGDYTPGQGASFEVHFEKARGFSGDEAEPMLCALDEDEHGKAVWTWRKLELATFDKVVSLANEGLTPVDIAEQLDVNKSTVSRHMKKARSQGLLRSEKS